MPLWNLHETPVQAVAPRYYAAHQGTGMDVWVTPSATISVKGDWFEAIASTPYDIDVLDIFCYAFRSLATDSAMLLDVGVGSAGNEVVIIPNLNNGGANGSATYYGTNYYVRTSIPAGSRIALRAQSSRLGSAGLCQFRLEGIGGGTLMGGMSPIATWDAFGADTANASGTSIDMTANSHTWGTWTSLGTASYDYTTLFCLTCTGLLDDTTNNYYRTQLTAAASTTEADTAAANGTVIEAELLNGTTNEYMCRLNSMWHSLLDYPVKAGQNIYVRGMSELGLPDPLYTVAYGGRG